MALRKFKPRSPEIYLNKIDGDNSVARLGHLNGLVDDVETKKADQQTGLATIPFQWYPDASVVETGAKYKYTDDTVLYGYKIMGMVNVANSNHDHLNEYLGTLVVTNSTMASIFPSTISGMALYYDDSDLLTSPLSTSVYLWDTNLNQRVLIEGVTVNFYQYDVFGNETWYAVLLESNTATGVELAGVINYEIEFSYPSDLNNTTFKIIQD
jgi:hypothetical protein